MNEIVFPITLDYVSHWEDNGWPIIRELASNALDADPGFKIALEDDDNLLTIRSVGPGLAVRHLLLGVSEKADPNSIGQFGEGLKLALLALTREDLTAYIYTKGMRLWNEPAELHGEQVFKVVWENHATTYNPDQTTIEIPNWPFKTFEERFVRPGDPRILFTDPFGRSILEEDSPGIYVKGIWVQRAQGYGQSYTFGYNLTDVTMNRDRGVVESWSVNAEIGKIWASVTDEVLLERFWQTVKDQMAEKNVNMRDYPIAHKANMKRAFQTVYGKDAVLQTSGDMAREAQYRGAEVLSATEVGYGLKQLAGEMVGTDAGFVAEMEGGDRMYLPDKKLPADKLKVLKMLRRMARRIGAKGNIYAYILPRDVNGESYKDDIRIGLSVLGNEEKALAVWLHEEAHRIHRTPDATASHVNAVAQVAAQVIASYACRR